MTGVGFAAGFRSPHGAGSLLAALGLVVAFGYAISWGFASLGLRVSDPEAAQAAAVPVVFLLVFTSAAFAPANAMPGWLQAFGTHQPVGALVNAERALILGGPAAHDVLISLAWSGGLLVVFALLAGLPVDPPVAHFTPVTLANGVSLDFDHHDHVDEHHNAFQLSDEEFQAAFGRIKDRGITYYADPACRQPGQVYAGQNGRRGTYFRDPNGHLMEILTPVKGETA
jgi:catechol 2,3-dioxygenase-like lactoylglutathione lyase family enzyme